MNHVIPLLELATYIAALYFWAWGGVKLIRLYAHEGQGVMPGTIILTSLGIVAIILVPYLDLSPFHLIWIFIVAFLLFTIIVPGILLLPIKPITYIPN